MCKVPIAWSRVTERIVGIMEWAVGLLGNWTMPPDNGLVFIQWKIEELEMMALHRRLVTIPLAETPVPQAGLWTVTVLVSLPGSGSVDRHWSR